MYSPFYPGAPRDIDEAARKIHRLLERKAAAREGRTSLPVDAALRSATAQPYSLLSQQLAQANAQEEPDTEYPTTGWPPSTAILDRVVVRNDGQGRGICRAPRAGHAHRGIDFLAPAGSSVYSPIEGTVSQLGWAYEDDAHLNERLRTIHVVGRDGQKFKLLYVEPASGLAAGDQVSRGTILGTAQNWQELRDTARNRTTPEGRRVTDHIHMEVFDPTGNRVDPTPWFDKWRGQIERRRRLERIEDRFHR